ncbi:hypothetical protein [Candidatus Enterovibrio escicola]|uniref:hypothetical protein n=1 Tax=Candidatus Enterovibrio escicola TaxID=1927127 RepID=UPI003743629F
MVDSRLDNLCKLSRKLINKNQVVCVESLQVKNISLMLVEVSSFANSSTKLNGQGVLSQR